MESISFEITDGVGVITLKRPEVFNSFNRGMALSVQQALDECAQNESIRAILLTAEGKAFCAGQDLKEATTSKDLDIERIVEEHYNPLIARMRSIEKPIVCAVNGVAAGAGANVALAADIVVAKKTAVFVQAFSSIGLIPDSGGTFFLPRLVGMQRAAGMMMLADKISAEDAVQMGMIYRCFEDEEFEQKSMAMAQKLSKLPTVALGLTKRLLNESMGNDLSTQLKREAVVQVESASSADFKEGVQAFLEKRSPKFTGK